MEQTLEYEVHPKENIYFVLKIIGALIGYGLIYIGVLAGLNSAKPQMFIVFAFYAILIILYLFFRLGFLVGHIKGNGVKITAGQFPEVHEIVLRQSKQLGLKNIPEVFILQNGGMLNAFAARFLGSNYIVIYSDVLEEAFANNIETVEFIIGHELGHIKRMHMTKHLLLFPSFIIPFLNSAYSRGCEFTCDNIGAALNPKGVRPGLILLASGKNLWRKVNIGKFTDQENTEGGFWLWFAEKVSTHPRLTKRVLRFQDAEPKFSAAVPEPTYAKQKVSDHSAYLPRS